MCRQMQRDITCARAHNSKGANIPKQVNLTPEPTCLTITPYGALSLEGVRLNHYIYSSISLQMKMKTSHSGS